MTKKPVGWRRETARHSLAARGIKSGRKKKRIIVVPQDRPKITTHKLSTNIKDDRGGRIPHVSGHRDVVNQWVGGDKAQGSRVFSTGDVIWSYGYHFPMAIRDRENKVVYVNTSKYSQSTSKHQSYTRSGAGALQDVGYKKVELETDQMQHLLNYKKVKVEEGKSGVVL